MNELTRLFLSKNAVSTLFTYMCKTDSCLADPVTSALHTMLTCPVRFRVSQYGVGFFDGKPVLPFSYMTADQRHYVWELVRAIGTRFPEEQHTAFACVDDALQYSFDNAHIVFKTNIVMDQSLVLGVLKDMVGNKPTLFSVLLQRLAGHVNLKKQVLQELEIGSR